MRGSLVSWILAGALVAGEDETFVLGAASYRRDDSSRVVPEDSASSIAARKSRTRSPSSEDAARTPSPSVGRDSASRRSASEIALRSGSGCGPGAALNPAQPSASAASSTAQARPWPRWSRPGARTRRYRAIRPW